MQRVRVTIAGDPSAPLQWDSLLKAFDPDYVGIRYFSDFWALVNDIRLPQVAETLARARVVHSTLPALNEEVYPLERQYEMRNIRAGQSRKAGPVYSGFHFVAICRRILLESGWRISDILRTIVVTTQRLGTYETNRWHLRSIILGAPCVISTTGAVEGPAKPRAYYLLKQTDPLLANEFLKGTTDWLTHDDPRLTAVVRAYLIQAFHFMDSPLEFGFCRNSGCVLSDPHWQADLIRTHAESSVPFCQDHMALRRFLRFEGREQFRV
ncbi:MAG: DUF6775 family putative metallopeptidase [bacterium JZ-2024 1]